MFVSNLCSILSIIHHLLGILTREVNGKTRLSDIKVRFKLNGDDVESRVDSLW